VDWRAAFKAAAPQYLRFLFCRDSNVRSGWAVGLTLLFAGRRSAYNHRADRMRVTAMNDTMDYLGQTDEDIFVPKYSDEDLEAAVGNPQSFPTFTCSVPMCATGGGCGTWPGN
jgi:hypothetical protein